MFHKIWLFNRKSKFRVFPLTVLQTKQRSSKLKIDRGSLEAMEGTSFPCQGERTTAASVATGRKTSVSTITGYISSLFSTFIARNYAPLFGVHGKRTSSWILFRLGRVTTTIPQRSVKSWNSVRPHNTTRRLSPRWRSICGLVIGFESLRL